MHFIPLYVSSFYNLLNSGLRLEDYFTYLRKNNYSAAGISDFNSFFAYPSFNKLAKDNNIKPLLGIQLSLGKYDFVAYPINEQGYLDLLAFQQQLNADTSLDILKKYSSNLIIILITDTSFLRAKSEVESVVLFKNFAMVTNCLYLGISRQNSPTDYLTSLRNVAEKYNYDLVAFPQIKYIKPEDELTLQLLIHIANDTPMNNLKAIKGDYYFPSSEELQRNYSQIELENTYKIANAIDFSFDKTRGELLHFDTPNERDSLHEATFARLTQLGLNNQLYTTRLNTELATIDKMGYNSYFLIVADYVKYAKNNKILVGPGRGSAAGSLVSYLLDITTVDPLKYDLLFERFLNIERQTMPDIDIDFMDVYRDNIVEYLKNKYGNDRVANIITFQTFAARAAIRDIGKIYEIDPRHTTLLTKSLGSSTLNLHDSYRNIKGFRELVDSDKFYLEIISLASKIEGFPRQIGMHAAGVILNDQPLINAVPVINNDGNLLTQYEMGSLEKQGFLKMDILGLTNLTIVDNCLKLIKEKTGTVIDYEEIPLDDENVYKLIASCKTLGIFQLESAGMIRAISQIKPSNFNDIVAILALFRPGPMENIPTYARRKHNLEKTIYSNKKLEEILSSTYGIIVYQEQIMQIATVMAGFSFSQADLFRRAISKKDDSLLQKNRESFISGCLNNGYSKEESNHTFNDILKFANYGFNKSHSVSYAKLAVQMAYLKYYYPLEFYASILNNMASGEPKFFEAFSELSSRGINLLLPSVNNSISIFKPTNIGLLMPLRSIKGVSTIIENKIFNARKDGLFTSYVDFFIRGYNNGLSKNDIRTLIEAGALDEFGKTRATLLSQVDNIELLVEVSLFTDENQNIDVRSLKDDESIKIGREIELLGIPISSNPIKLYEKYAREKDFIGISEITTQYVKVFGTIKSVKTIKTKKNDQMAFVKIWDYVNDIEVTVFPDIFSSTYSLLKQNNLIGVKGKIEERDGKRQIIASSIESIGDEDE